MTGGAPISALLACDLDGTLIREGGAPAAGIVEALADLARRGARLVVCTGRPLYSAETVADTLHAQPVAYVCYHGALVVDAATGEWLRHQTIPPGVAATVVHGAFERGLAVTVYDGDERRELGVTEVGRAGELAATVGVTRLILSGDLGVLAGVLAGGDASWLAGTRRTRAGGGTVAVLPAAADKGSSLRLVAAHLGVPGERIVACGDDAADETMLLAAAVGIAVGDAPPPLRAAAQLVVDQDRLADALRRAVSLLG